MRTMSREDEENRLRNLTGQPLTGGPLSILARQKESKFIVEAMVKFTRPEKRINRQPTQLKCLRKRRLTFG